MTGMNIKNISVNLKKWKSYAGLIILIIVIASLYWTYKHPKVIYQSIYYPLPPVIKTEKVYIPIKVEVLNKAEAIKKIALPEEIISNSAKQITSTGIALPYEGTTNIVNVIDTESGKSIIFAKQNPLPPMEFLNNREIGVRYNGWDKEVYGRWQFFRAGGVRLGLYGEMGDGGSRVMVEASYKF